MMPDASAIAANVDYNDALAYLRSRGWHRSPSARHEVAIFRKDAAEVQIPLDRELADYAEAVATAAMRVARVEGRTAEIVLADLRRPRNDTLRVGRTDGDSEDGTLDFEQSTSLVAGIRRAILSAACSVERPTERFHRRMSFKKAQELVQKCRLGQTERGSFVVAVHCPIDLNQLSIDEHFGRETVQRLMRSVATTVYALRADGVAAILSQVETDPLITANLCDALVEMMPSDERGDLWLSASWSPLISAPTDIPERVRIDRDMYRAFEDLGRELRPPVEPKQDQFVGRVVDLHGEDNADGELEGDVSLSIQVGEELVRARSSFGPTDYSVAIAAHQKQRYLSVRGLLHRRSRAAVLEDTSEVKIVE
jgi:hypothetical protein